MSRVTKVICPCCEGGRRNTLGWSCGWCCGTGRAKAHDAAQYADAYYTFAVGGYIAGDHDLDDMIAMKAKANRVFALLQRPAPWGARP